MKEHVTKDGKVGAKNLNLKGVDHSFEKRTGNPAGGRPSGGFRKNPKAGRA